MPYTPSLQAITQPAGTVAASTAAEEFRMMKRAQYLTIPVDDMAGADIGAKTNAAIAEVVAAGLAGNLVYKAALYEFATMMNFDGKRNMTVGMASGPAGGGQGARFLWTGGAGSGPAISAKGTGNMRFKDFNLQPSLAAYNGNLIDIESTVITGDTWNIIFDNLRIGGSAGVNQAAAGVKMGFNYKISFLNCYFASVLKGVYAAASSNNAITFQQCYFDADIPIDIEGRSGSWAMRDCVQQCDPAAGVTTFFKSIGEMQTLIIEGGLLGVDSGAAGGTCIDLSAAGALTYGGSIRAVLFAMGSGTAIKCSDTAGATSGLEIMGNRINAPLGVNLGRAHAIKMNANHFTCTNPFTGNEPTNCDVSNNNTLVDPQGCYSHLVASGGGKKAVTIGSARTGMGTYQIIVPGLSLVFEVFAQGASGLVAMLGTSNAALSSATLGTAGKINFGWDAAYGTGAYVIQNNYGADGEKIIVNYRGL